MDGEGRLARAAHLVARLASDLVTPEDLRADGPGAAAAATLGRKNLKQLRRIRHEATHGSDGAERRDAASRPHKERAWPALDVERLAPDRCGYVPIDASIPPDAEDDAAEERAGGEDAPRLVPRPVRMGVPTGVPRPTPTLVRMETRAPTPRMRKTARGRSTCARRCGDWTSCRCTRAQRREIARGTPPSPPSTNSSRGTARPWRGGCRTRRSSEACGRSCAHEPSRVARERA